MADDGRGEFAFYPRMPQDLAGALGCSAEPYEVQGDGVPAAVRA